MVNKQNLNRTANGLYHCKPTNQHVRTNPRDPPMEVVQYMRKLRK
jgi:hypothetical protein